MNRSRIKNHIRRVIEKNIHLVDTWPLKPYKRTSSTFTSTKMRPFSTRENASRQKCTFASASWKALIAIAFNLARLKTSNIIGPSYKMYALGRDSIEDDLMNREMKLPAMNELQVFQVQYFRFRTSGFDKNTHLASMEV